MAPSPNKYDPDPKTDRWFDWKGVKPPEKFPSGVHDTESHPLSEQLSERLKGHKCNWKQAGTDVYCTSGGFRHGKIIGPDRMLVFEDGKPKLVARRAIPRDTKPTGSDSP